MIDMIVKEELLSKLRTYFSLNLYEVKIWTSLLSRGTSTAGELAEISNVPRSRSYDVLESLEKKGFVIMKLGKPIKYLPINPGEVIERVKKHMRGEAERKVERLEKIKNSDLIKELNNIHSQGLELVEPSELAGSLKGRTNLYNHLDTMIKNSKKSVSIATTSQGLIRKIAALKPSMEAAKKKGVKIRITAPMTEDVKERLKDVAETADFKHSDMKARFCVVDSKEMMFMVLNDDDVHPTYDLGVWVNTPFFSSALERMFDKNWNEMKSVPLR